MNRGSGHVWSASAAVLCAFNEAPIHESGKYSDSLATYKGSWPLQ